MREFMNWPAGRGVTVTMIANRLAGEQLDVTTGRDKKHGQALAGRRHQARGGRLMR